MMTICPPEDDAAAPPEAFSALKWRRDGRPRGLLGWIAAQGMPLVNRRENRALVEWLAPAPGDAILEIGFGPGVTARALARRTPNGLVAGVDHSAVMLRRALRRNLAAVAEGRMLLCHGSPERLPFRDGMFDAAVAVNVFHFFAAPAAACREIGRVLRPGGRLAFATRGPRAGRGYDIAKARHARARQSLAEAGFTELDTAIVTARGPHDVIIISGRRR